MKKLIFTLAICIGVLSARASYLPSSLTIRMWDHSLISVLFDGNTYNQVNSSYTFSNLSGGSHYLKVFRHSVNSHGVVSSFPKMVFSGYISIAPGKSIEAMISGECRFIVLSEYNVGPAVGYTNGDHYDGNHHGNGHHGDGHHNNGGYNGNNAPSGYYTDYSYAPVGMSEYDFMSLKSIVANTPFDDTKLTLCKQAVGGGYITSNQVCELMNMLTFESSKLELAKYAYRYVVDKSRYYVVNSAFTFSSSIDELNRYIFSF